MSDLLWEKYRELQAVLAKMHVYLGSKDPEYNKDALGIMEAPEAEPSQYLLDGKMVSKDEYDSKRILPLVSSDKILMPEGVNPDGSKIVPDVVEGTAIIDEKK